MENVYCRYCGLKSSSVSNLTAGSCPRHPNGVGKGKHTLYEGEEKSQYTCKYCVHKSSTISNLTPGSCPRHPDGINKGHHEPAL